jgi:outer membrane murein-binding lipoprotein Lpp
MTDGQPREEAVANLRISQVVNMQTSGLVSSSLTPISVANREAKLQNLSSTLSNFREQLDQLTQDLKQNAPSAAATPTQADTLVNALSELTSYLKGLNSGVYQNQSTPESAATSTTTPPTGTQNKTLLEKYQDIKTAPDNASFYQVPVEFGGTQSNVSLDSYQYQNWLRQVADGQDPNAAALRLSGDGIGTAVPRLEAGFTPLGYALGRGYIEPNGTASADQTANAKPSGASYLVDQSIKQAALNNIQSRLTRLA